MKTSVQKWGNSLAIRLPKSFARELGLGEGMPADLTLEDGAIVLRPGRDRAYDLEELLAGVTAENIHPVWEAEAAAAGAGEDETPDGRGEDGS